MRGIPPPEKPSFLSTLVLFGTAAEFASLQFRYDCPSELREAP